MSAALAYRDPPVAITEDEIKVGVKLAFERIEEVKSMSSSSLIDSLSDEDWENWDESDMCALVADKDGLEPVDTLDF